MLSNILFSLQAQVIHAIEKISDDLVFFQLVVVYREHRQWHKFLAPTKRRDRKLAGT